MRSPPALSPILVALVSVAPGATDVKINGLRVQVGDPYFKRMTEDERFTRLARPLLADEVICKDNRRRKNLIAGFGRG
jgi:hypothetical protein